MDGSVVIAIVAGLVGLVVVAWFLFSKAPDDRDVAGDGTSRRTFGPAGPGAEDQLVDDAGSASPGGGTADDVIKG